MKRSISVLAWCLAAVFLVAGNAHAAPEGVACAPEPTDELIEYGDLRNCSISPTGESDLFRFVGALNEIVRIVGVELGGGFPTTPDICVELRDPTGVVISTGCAEVSRVLEPAPLAAAGVYTIRVFEAGDDQAMNYRVVLERVFPTSPTITPLENGISLASEMISPSGDIDLYGFEGTVGDLSRIDATEGGGGFPTTPDVCIDLRRPDGSSVDSKCGEVSAALETTLDENGPYTLILTEAGNDQAMNANLLYSCLFGSCESLALPRCTLNLNQAAYVAGETVMLQNFHVVNPTSDTVDLKLWLSVPGFPPVTVIAGGLPAGFDQNFGTIFFQAIPPWFPLGTYGIDCRMLATVTGETLGLDLNPFEVQ